jgi:hypothetical protein
MASWANQGHGMRRRTGAPSNTLEAAGKSMARTNPTPEEAAVATPGNARIPMGMSAYEVQPQLPSAGTPVPRHNTQAADPTNPGSKVNRTNVPYNERMGAAFEVKAFLGRTIDPAAGATMANARIVPSVAGRGVPNFQGGNEDGYL